MRKTLKAFETMLSDADFLRIHRSYIISVSAIETVDFNNNQLIIQGIEIPISRNKRNSLEQLLRRVE
ncbi:MAG: LytTR family DNA-binding domain-containing protein [Saprospiraceae bacterium]